MSIYLRPVCSQPEAASRWTPPTADFDGIIKPNCPSPDIRVAFIVDNGAPVEVLQFDRPEGEVWPRGAKFRTSGLLQRKTVRPKSSRRPGRY